MVSADSIIGHSKQTSELSSDVERGNVAHAYLFAGADHLGKMTVARWFAKRLMVEGAAETAKEKILSQCDKLTYADFLVLDALWIEGVREDWTEIAKSSNAPQQHRSKKPAAKSDVIGIDEIRALQSRLQETALGKYKVCVIRGVERMQDAAANALLKILEEPPAGLVFVLTTSSTGSVLPTIVSRARVVRFNRVGNAEIMKLLKDFSSEERAFMAGLSQGAPGIALTLRRNPDLLRESKQTHAQAHAFWSTRSLRERLKLLKPLEQKGDEADAFLKHLALTLREQPDPASVRALSELGRGLRTNAHRGLLSQRFALSIPSNR